MFLLAFFRVVLPFEGGFIAGRRCHEEVDDQLAGDLVFVLRGVNQTPGAVRQLTRHLEYAGGREEKTIKVL